MKPIRGSVLRLASLIALGCLLGAATVAGTTVVSAAPALSAAPASADCGGGHANVEGYSTGYHYGNRARIYVNTNTVILSLHNALYRSLFIYVDGNNNVEIGWGAGPNSITGDFPTVYAYWWNRGTPGDRIYKATP